MLVLANKQDLPGAADTTELSRALDLGSLWHKLLVQGTAAQRGEGLFEGFDWLARVLPQR